MWNNYVLKINLYLLNGKESKKYNLKLNSLFINNLSWYRLKSNTSSYLLNKTTLRQCQATARRWFNIKRKYQWTK